MKACVRFGVAILSALLLYAPAFAAQSAITSEDCSMTINNDVWKIEIAEKSELQNDDTETEYRTPKDIEEAFIGKEWDGYEPVFPKYYIVESGYENGQFYPVIMKNEEKNILCVLSKKLKGWSIDFSNENVLYRGNLLPSNISYYCDVEPANYADNHSQKFDFSYETDPAVDGISEIHFQFTILDGQWTLAYIQVRYAEAEGNYVGGLEYRETMILAGVDHLIYQEVLNEKDIDKSIVPFSGSYLLESFDVCSISLND